jgi:hypothetical protein
MGNDNPKFAGKLTGRMNRTSVAYVVARDENSPIIVPLEERSGFISAGKSTSNILRVRRNFLQDSYIGELFLRLVVQYNDFSHGLNLEPLLSYKINPFTIFYIGSTHAYEELGARQELAQPSRQFFMKFQYLFRI